VFNAYIAATFLTVGFLFLGQRALKQKPRQENDDKEKLRTWLESDGSRVLDINTGRAHQAEQVVSKIISSSCRRGLVVFGEYGAGKTTLIQEVTKKLPDEDWITINFSAWGKNQLVALLLKDIINGLSAKFETHLVQQLPSDLVKALGQASPDKGVANFIFSSMQPSSDSINTLQRLNDLLVTHGKYCLVIIEDVDRGDKSVENLNILSALFDLLTYSPRIKYIFTLKEEKNTKVPLVKILDHRVTLSEIKPIYAILTFIDLCRSDAKKKGVILTDENFNSEPLIPDSYDSAKFEEIYSRTIYGSISQALNNPRDLTSTLRETWSIWGGVMGDVNILDVLIYTIIYKVAHNNLARNIIEGYASHTYRKLDHKDIREFIIETIPNDKSLRELTEHMLVGQTGNRNDFQSIRLAKDLQSEFYLSALKEQKQNDQVLISRIKLEKVRYVWSDEWEVSPESLDDMNGNYSDLKPSYEAYISTQDPAKFIQFHGDRLRELFWYICRESSPIEKYSEDEYLAQVYPLKFYLRLGDKLKGNYLVNWIKMLNGECLDQKSQWLLVFIYEQLLTNSPDSLQIKVRESLASSLKELTKKIDFKYLYSIPVEYKWDVVGKYNASWSARDDLLSLRKKEPLALWQCFIAVEANNISSEKYQASWHVNTCKKLNISKLELVEWLEIIRNPEHWQKDGKLTKNILQYIDTAKNTLGEQNQLDNVDVVSRIEIMLNEESLIKVGSQIEYS